MTPSRRAAVAALATAAVAAACASEPGVSASRPADLAARILEGFDPLEPGSEWKVGDRILFDVRVDDRGEHREWLIHCELVRFGAGEPFGGFHFTDHKGRPWAFGSRTARVRVGVIDERGRSLGVAEVSVPGDALRKGFHGSVSRLLEIAADRMGSVATRPPSRPSERDDLEVHGRFLEMLSSLLGFLELFRKTEPVEAVRARLVDAVLDTPSFFSVLFRMGVSLGIHPDFASVTTRPSHAPGTVDALAVPIDVRINDDLALRYDLVVVPPDPPLHVAAGVLAIEGSHPEDPARRFAVRLLAARRGPPLDAAAAEGRIPDSP